MTWDFFGGIIDQVGAQAHSAGTFEPIRLSIDLHPKQEQFFDFDGKYCFFGGGVGGGKSLALLVSAAKYAHVPKYSAVLIRRRFSDLEQSGGLIPLSRWLFRNTGAVYRESTRTWTFPSGATISFGYLDSQTDLDRYQGGQWVFIGVDEATQIPADRLQFLTSRLRRTEELGIPVRFRLTGNPGGVSHEWVKENYVEAEQTDDLRFIPSLIRDNPSLDPEYIETLSALDPLTRQRLLEGDWNAVPDGNMFKRDWFRVIRADQLPRGIRWVRYWDLASTADGGDHTCGALVGRRRDSFFVGGLERFRLDPEGVEQRVRQVAETDGHRVPIFVEQEPGSSGKSLIDYYRRRVLGGFRFEGHRVTGSKIDRARPLANAAASGRLVLVEGSWVPDFLDEAVMFPAGPHDDQIDAVSGGLMKANEQKAALKWLHVTDL